MVPQSKEGKDGFRAQRALPKRFTGMNPEPPDPRPVFLQLFQRLEVEVIYVFMISWLNALKLYMLRTHLCGDLMGYF
jgi:hypothetical protein